MTSGSEPSGPTKSGKGLSLVGYRGSGKSTVGRLLAGRLGLAFLDTDALLEDRFGRPIFEVFRENGEPAFREMEERIVAEVASGPPAVLATGGGAVLRERNRAALKAFGPVVWLKTGAAVLAERLSTDAQGVASRPQLTEAGTLSEIKAVLAARLPIYEGIADVTIATDGQVPEALVEAILASCPELIRGTGGTEGGGR